MIIVVKSAAIAVFRNKKSKQKLLTVNYLIYSWGVKEKTDRLKVFSFSLFYNKNYWKHVFKCETWCLLDKAIDKLGAAIALNEEQMNPNYII